MRIFRKVLKLIFIVAAIIGVVYIIMHFNEILRILPLDELKSFFGKMFSYIIHVFKNIIDWFKGIFH